MFSYVDYNLYLSLYVWFCLYVTIALLWFYLNKGNPKTRRPIDPNDLHLYTYDII